MTLLSRPFGLAMLGLGVSVFLHLLALPFSGFASMGVTLFVTGLVYGAALYGLSRGWRWLGFVMFLVLFVGLAAALASTASSGAVPVWIYAGIAGANIVALLGLFGALWRDPAPA